MKLFNKICREEQGDEKPAFEAARGASPAEASNSLLDEPDRLKCFLAELDEAMKRIAAGTAGQAQYFVVVRAWIRLHYHSILCLERELGQILPGGRAAARLLLVLFLFFCMWAWPF
jgi:hypothetical protein